MFARVPCFIVVLLLVVGVRSAGADPGGFLCEIPKGKVQLVLKDGFTAHDLAVAYIGLSCTTVVLPKELAQNRRDAGVNESLTPKQIDKRFRALFDELGIVMLRERGAVVLVDKALLTPQPNLLLVRLVTPLVPTTPAPVPALAGLTVKSELHRVVSGPAVAALVAEGTTRGARMVPSIKNGQPNGIKVYSIRPSSAHARLGFKNGDTVHTINGVAVASQDDLTVASLLRTPARLDVAITRRGAPLVLVIEVE